MTPSSGTDDGIYHCFCTAVTQEEVLRALAGGAARSVEGVSRATGACTGCQSCRRELEALLAAVAEGRVRLPAAEPGRG